jgi:hypothetical protein
MCRRCLAVFGSDDQLRQEEPEEGSGVWCPVCAFDFMQYQEKATVHIEFDNIIDHSRTLAAIASTTPLMRALYTSLGQARKFVHFITYGISHMHLGALKVVAQKVPVRGIIANVDTTLSAEINNYADESPYMELRLFKQRGPSSPEDSQPHQKLIVIDGLLAFKGSANLTLSGWRKAAIGRDVIEVVTNVNEVRELHNRFFSPIWFETNPSERYDYAGTPYWGKRY